MQSPLIIHFQSCHLTDEQFYQLCQDNRDLRFERNAYGNVLIMPPTGGETSNRNLKIIQKLGNWTDKNGTGIAFDSSGGFKLPNGADRSPNASWIPLEKMKEYINNGTKLGWLINRRHKQVEICRQGQEVEILNHPQSLSGEDVLVGFELDLDSIW